VRQEIKRTEELARRYVVLVYRSANRQRNELVMTLYRSLVYACRGRYSRSVFCGGTRCVWAGLASLGFSV